MIRLRHDCLVFESQEDGAAPASADQIALELTGLSAPLLDEDTLKNAAHAVLHYFKADLGQETVSANEFARALEKALQGLGFDVTTNPVSEHPARILEADLGTLARQSSVAGELMFFPRLRNELRRQLEQAPEMLRFHGLRQCVKKLAGAKRWSPRCQGLNDQIVAYLRQCLTAEQRGTSCALIVQ